MRMRVAIPFLAAVCLAAAPPAWADFQHVVLAGESLSSIAATDGLSVDALAAANGISPDSQLQLGQSVQIPPIGSAGSSADAQGSGAGAQGSGASAQGSTAGGYVVAPGDTLGAIAARAGTTVDQLAAANGLDPSAILPVGTVLSLSGSSPQTSGAQTTEAQSAGGQPVGAVAEGSPSDPPYPTAQTLSASDIGQIAAANGVPPSLADAIAWQESGFNNDLVSSADARGIMQVLPGTWSWIQQSLTAGAPPLQPASATDNVRGGALMLHWLLQQTGGDQAAAAAAYYQGLSSVQSQGMLSSTQQYVHSVTALEHHFGGG
jgi:N-acetylmuramoyl-L-alanine amidase